MTSELKVDKISPASGTAGTIGDNGDTFTVPSGVTLDVASGATLDATGATVTGIEANLVKISSGNWSSGTDTLSFSSVFDGTYKNYVLYVNAVYSSSDFRIGIQVERGGGYISSTNYHFACQGVNAAGTETTDSNNNSDRITTNPANAHGGAATKTYNAIIHFFDPYNSATYTQIGGDITAWLASDNGSFAQFGGADLTAGSCTGFRLLTSAGTLGANAPYALYGVKS